MGTPDGRERDGLSRELLRAAHRFDFYQAVRLLEARLRERDRGSGPGRVGPAGAGPARGGEGPDDEGRGVGRDLRPENEAVRFRALPSLGFPAAAISEVREPGPDRPPGPPEMVVTFLGLVGPSGVLPRHYTELLLRRLREKDHALRDFLDLFHHRLVSLLFRAWEKYRIPFTYERARLDRPDGPPDPATDALRCLVGMGTPGLSGRLEVRDELFLYFSGHFAHFPRSASALEAMLGEFLAMPVRILQCRGQWLALDPADRAVMPSARAPKGRNNQLGVDLVVGERVWDVQSRFRIRVGPLTWPQFRSLMPDGRGLRPACQVARTFVGPTLDFDVQPVLRGDQVPPCRLHEDPDAAPRLGWNTWLPSLPADGPAPPRDDAIFELPSV